MKVETTRPTTTQKILKRDNSNSDPFAPLGMKEVARGRKECGVAQARACHDHLSTAAGNTTTPQKATYHGDLVGVGWVVGWPRKGG